MRRLKEFKMKSSFNSSKSAKNKLEKISELKQDSRIFRNTDANVSETFSRISFTQFSADGSICTSGVWTIRIPFGLICVARDYVLTLRHAWPFIKASLWTLSACLLSGQPSAHCYPWASVGFLNRNVFRKGSWFPSGCSGLGPILLHRTQLMCMCTRKCSFCNKSYSKSYWLPCCPKAIKSLAVSWLLSNQEIWLRLASGASTVALVTGDRRVHVAWIINHPLLRANLYDTLMGGVRGNKERTMVSQHHTQSQLG